MASFDFSYFLDISHAIVLDNKSIYQIIMYFVSSKTVSTISVFAQNSTEVAFAFFNQEIVYRFQQFHQKRRNNHYAAKLIEVLMRCDTTLLIRLSVNI